MDKTFDVLYKTRLFKTSSEETIYETLRRHGVYTQSACGGTGRCGKCRIRVQGILSEPDDTEKSALGEAELELGIRLACRAKARGDLRIFEIDSLESDAFALSEPFSASERQRMEGCEPRIRLIERTWPEETETSSDMEWLFQDLGQGALQSPLFLGNLSPALAASLSRKLPELLQFPRFTELRLDGQLRGFLTEEEALNPHYYIAVDIGTTTLTLFLLDTNGKWKGGLTAKNPQIPFGTDVIARINHARTPGGLEELRTRLTTKIDGMIQEVKDTQRISAERILCVGLVGNTCMQQLFWGILPERLGERPFRAFTTETLSSNAIEAGFYALEAHTPVVFLPSVAGYVGSDALAGALWCELDRQQSPYLLVDIGTNGEMMLNRGNEVFCCSTAAGPALEGMNISHGMPGVEGAITGVDTAENGEIRYTVIGDGPPKGLCGSGLISLIAWLLQQRVLKPGGAFEKPESLANPPKDLWRDERGQVRWRIRGDEVFLDQRDVRQFQLAKGAIRCGIDILLENAGMRPEDLAGVFLSGSFGNALDRRAAVATGLLPPIDPSKITCVGNAACKGLSLWLACRQSTERLETLRKRMRSVRLEGHPEFSDLFGRSMRLGEFT